MVRIVQAQFEDQVRRALSVLRFDRSWRWFILGFALLLAGFLIGPRIPSDLQRYNCVGNIALAGPFAIHLNCDAPEFLVLATRPRGLLEENNYRQSRPGLILAAAALTFPLSFVAKPIAVGSPPEEDPDRIIDSFERYLPAYLAYMLLNAGILILSFHFFRKIARCRGLDEHGLVPIVVSVGLLLVANDVTKAFFGHPIRRCSTSWCRS